MSSNASSSVFKATRRGSISAGSRGTSNSVQARMARASPPRSRCPRTAADVLLLGAPPARAPTFFGASGTSQPNGASGTSQPNTILLTRKGCLRRRDPPPASPCEAGCLRITQLTNFQTRDFEAGLAKAAAAGSVFNQSLDDVLITMGCCATGTSTRRARPRRSARRPGGSVPTSGLDALHCAIVRPSARPASAQRAAKPPGARWEAGTRPTINPPARVPHRGSR